MKRVLSFALLLSSFVGGVAADEAEPVRIQFKPGSSEAVISDKVTGRESVVYQVNAREGQWLEVQMLPGVKGADFNIYIPGRGPGDEALFNSLVGDRGYLGQLHKTGDHSISVFLNRAAARREDVAEYKMLVRITDKKPSEEMLAEEEPAVGPVPQKVIDDCLAALEKQIPDKTMKVISAKRGETSFIVDVEVKGVPNPWRCYHDGTECTGTEYQGEG